MLQIWKLRNGHNAQLLFRLWAQGLVKILELKFRRDFEAEVRSVFCCWCLVEVTKLNLGQDSEARFGQDFKFKFSRDTEVWLRFWSKCLIEILKLDLIEILKLDLIEVCVRTIEIWTQPSGPLGLWQCLIDCGLVHLGQKIDFIPNQTYQTKPTKPDLPNQTYICRSCEISG